MNSCLNVSRVCSQLRHVELRDLLCGKGVYDDDGSHGSDVEGTISNKKLKKTKSTKQTKHAQELETTDEEPAVKKKQKKERKERKEKKEKEKEKKSAKTKILTKHGQDLDVVDEAAPSALSTEAEYISMMDDLGSSSGLDLGRTSDRSMVAALPEGRTISFLGRLPHCCSSARGEN